MIIHLFAVNGPFPAEKVLVRATVPGYPERAHHALLAGTIGGYVVWGRYSSINHQILLYLASRMSLALWKRVVLKGESKPHPRAFSVISALMWGLAMMLYEDSPHVLNPSLKSSMDEIYRYNLQSTGESTETSPSSSNGS
jgi:peroxisomal membrane protein 4